ncbi:MAG TPA: ABC transporter permease [Verrucomicrobiae bacterium]|nr:ABC transporter permease [Verrucomicrobiae bacterium]
MKLATLALSTLESFLQNRMIVLILVLAACVVLLMMFPLLNASYHTTAENQQSMASVVLEVISNVMSFVSGLGSLLAAWAAVDAVSSELKSGTVLAVMARPVKRWQFLLGKFLGVMLFMACYVGMLISVSYLLAWLGGVKIQAAPWVLLVYPLVRYSIYAALATLCATAVHPVVSMGAIFVVSILTDVVMPGTVAWYHKVAWLKTAIYYVLPSTNLLTEGRFLSLRQAAVKQTTLLEHAISLGYGLDCALIFLLLAMWAFHYRSLLRQD